MKAYYTDSVDAGISRAEVRLSAVSAEDCSERVRSNTARVGDDGRGVVAVGHVVPQRYQQRPECLRPPANQLRSCSLRRYGQ